MPRRFPASWALLAIACLTVAARGEPISGNSGLEGLGKFEGSFSYASTDSGHATVTIQLTNVSDAANGGYLTAFAFNNPGNRITGATLETAADFGILGGVSYDNSIDASPFGAFDLGASTSNQFLGGGNPNTGLGVGESATFVFHLTGNGLDGLNVALFFDTLSDAHDDKAIPFLARFRGFVNGGSDKVPGKLDGGGGGGGGLQGAPEPSSLALAGIAAVCLTTFRACRRRKTDNVTP